MTQMFADRRDAGRALAAALMPIEPERTVVLALPRGGVVVADEICRVSGAPLDLMLVRKLGLPGQEELAVGAIAEASGEIFVPYPEMLQIYGLDQAALERIADRERVEIERRRRAYLGDRRRQPLAGRVVIVVDDGVATGATMVAALRAAAVQKAERIICAIPVAPREAVPRLKREADALVCLETPEPFVAVGAHYRDFRQVSDAEVVAILDERRRARAAAGGTS